MTRMRVLRLGSLMAAAVCAFVTMPREANATVIYGGQAEATLTVLSVGGPAQSGDLLFTSQTGDSMDTFMAGDAMALASASATGDDVDWTWDLGVVVFGQAAASPGEGFAFTQAFSDIEILITNTSLASSAQILFEFAYIVAIGGSVTDPVTEFGEATATVTLDSLVLGTVFDLGFTFDTHPSEPGGTEFDAFQFSIVLGPGESDTLSILAGADGVALALADPPPVPVPAPAVLPLLVLGLAGLGFSARRRDKR